MSTSAVPVLAVSRPAPRAGGDGDVRVTVHPGEDVLLPAGASLGACRAALADLLRRPELRHAPLTADGSPVADADVVGHRPLLPGAVLAAGVPSSGPHRPGARGVGDTAVVLGRPWLVARADGADAGAAASLSPGVATAPPEGDRSAGAPRASAAGVVVRADPRRPDLVTVRTTARAGRAAGLPRLVRPDAPARRRPRRVGRLSRRWRPGDRLELTGPHGSRSWTLHRSGDAATWLDAVPGRGTGDAPGPSGAPGAGMLATAALPVAGSLVLAAVLRQPAYALFSLLGLATLVPQLVAARRRRRAGAAQDAAAAGTGAPGDGSGPGTPADRVVGDAPGPLLARLVAAHHSSDGAWRAAAARAATRSRAPGHGRGAPGGAAPDGAVARLVPDGAIAVVGVRAEALAAARSMLVELAAAGAAVDVAGADDAWSWCRWLPAGGPPVLVVDLPDTAADAGALVDAARREDLVARGGAVLLCLPDGAPVPAWCRTTWRVRGESVRRAAPDGSATSGPLVGVTAAWAERAARLVAGLAGLRRSLGALDLPDGRNTAGGPGAVDGPGDDGDPADPRLPAVVPLLALLDDPGDPGPAWDAADGWAVPVGRDARGRAVSFDLVADGPHLLVAGTTGAGKSELLQSLVLGLAARRSPRDLALALVDFKGGASFGACAGLPHVVGQVTDLDPGLAGRALAGLRAELRRREHVLARHGVSDLAALSPGLPDAPPRLVVVVDEFRALADDLPDFLPGLLRVAAQGRSLGVHLVLATQRPAGAVSADVRANVSARLALRVVDAADSLDVVETSAAARIPPGVPGRAVLRRGAEPPVVLQCAHAAARPAAGSVVRRAPAWGAPPTVPTPPDDDASHDAAPGVVERLVDGARAAAEARGLRPGPAPWLPPLPDRLRADDVDLSDADDPREEVATGTPAGLPVALGDDPGRQRRALLRWDPEAGHLGVVGRSRSGRTTTLVTLAQAALDRGWHVHALAPAAALARFAALEDRPGLGTLAGPQSPRRAARLLRLLGSLPAPAPTLVVVDGVEELRAALAGPDPWDPLTRALATPGVAFALASDGAMVGGLAARVGPRLVLLGREPHADVVLGAPSELAGRGGPPGRAAWLGRQQLLCQVLLPAEAPARTTIHPVAPPPVVRPLPATVEERDLAPSGRHRAAAGDGAGDDLVVPVGVGGDEAAPVGLDVAHGALVTGPRGSGRTTVLRVVARRLAATGRLAGVVARDAALRGDAGAAPAVAPSPAALGRLLDGLGPGVLVVDDLDALAQQLPLEAERLMTLLDGGGHALVASSTTTGTALAHRGALAELRARRTGVVLHPGERGADDLLGVPLADAADPGPARPGRAALVVSGRVQAVQVALPGHAPPASAGGRLDHPAGHDGEQHRDGDRQQPDAREHAPRGARGEQADADEALHDLPHDHRRASAAPPGPQGAARGDEQPAQPEAEEDQEDAHGDAVRGAAHELETDQHSGGDEQQHLDRDPHRDHPQPGRPRAVRAVVGAGRGGDRSAHDTSEYVRPAVSRQCDQALTLHARETST